MQKGRPAARLSMDKDHTNKHDSSTSYDKGYSAGYEAGRRASIGEGAKQRFGATTGQRFSAGATHQRSPSVDKKGFGGARQVPIKTTHYQTNNDKQQYTERRIPDGGVLSDNFQGRRSFDDPNRNREHEMNGQISNPETEVKFNGRGHY